MQNMHHMYRAYGGWTFAFEDYTDLNITSYLDDPRMKMLADIVDPYSKLVKKITKIKTVMLLIL